MRAVMARGNIGVADDGRLQLQDFGNVSEMIRNTKTGKRFKVDSMLVLIDEDKDKQFLIPISRKAEYIRLSSGTIDYASDIEDMFIGNY